MLYFYVIKWAILFLFQYRKHANGRLYDFAEKRNYHSITVNSHLSAELGGAATADKTILRITKIVKKGHKKAFEKCLFTVEAGLKIYYFIS